MPPSAAAAFQDGFAAHQAGNLARAEFVYQLVLAGDKKNYAALHFLGLIDLQRGNTGAAERLIRKALTINPRYADAHCNLGIALQKLGRFDESLASYDKALALEPRYAEAHYNRGIVLKELKRFEEAIESYDKALAIKPGYAEAYSNRGNALQDLRRLDDALASFEKALTIRPSYAEAYYNRGNVLRDLGRFESALASYDKALALKPDYAEVYSNRGNALQKLGQYDDALASYDKALTIRPHYAEAHCNRGNALKELKQYQEALASYDKALALKPDYAEVHFNRGLALNEIKRYEDALASYDKALTLRSNYAEAYSSRGNALQELKRFEDALESYDKALSMKPNNVEPGHTIHRTPDGDSLGIAGTPVSKEPLRHVEAARLYTKMRICDWRNLDAERSQLLAAVRTGAAAVSPFALLAMSASPSDQLNCAQSCTADTCPPSATPLWSGERYVHDKIRIAYLSADFRNHPVSYAIAGMFEHHDRTQFEPIAVSLMYHRKSDMTERIKNAFELFIDVQDRSDRDTAELLRQLEVDIAIDLTGFTGDNRLGVLANRPAPIQVNYLGYPGTMGAGYIDYILADPTIIPEEQREFYTEQVVWLPGSYHVNDNQRPISQNTPTRHQCGLPDAAFVYCCFNSPYKITPEIFDVWMRLLNRTENSVLWLYGENPSVSTNLRREAEKRGISAERLILAPGMPFADHLARHRQADLFLDTLPYNAHTTANDALWAGLPVLTCLGESFSGRVAASLLKAAGVPELITHSLEDYEALALRLAQDPLLLASVKAKVVRNRDAFPLFDTERSTRHVEAAYKIMWQKLQRGEPAASFVVKPID